MDFKNLVKNTIFTAFLFLGIATPVLADQTNSLTGSFSALNQTVNFESQAPANGGDLNGNFTGACTGTIEGNYGGSNHLITGLINGQCNILGFTQPFILNYDGSVDPINKTLTVTSVTHIDGSSSQAATLLGLPQTVSVSVTTTENNLTTGTTYTDPQNNQVQVNFNNLPANSSGNLSFSQLAPSVSQISQFNIVSPVAYKISSSLTNGTFNYNLTLPLPSGFDPNLLVVKFGDSLDELSGVIRNLIFNADNTISILNLDHFTYFVLSVEVPEPIVNAPATINSSNQTNYSISGTATPNTFVNFLFTDSASNYLYTYELIGANGLFNLTGIDLSFLTDGLTNLEVWVDDSLSHFSDSLFFSFTKDTVAPNLTSTTITTSNPNSSSAKAGDTITLDFTSSEAMQNPVVTIAGHAVTAVNTVGNNWRAIWVLTDVDTEGLINYTINYSDSAGNTGTAVNTNSAVNFDSTNPTGSSNNVISGWFNSNPGITLSVSDALSGLNNVRYNWNSTASASVGTVFTNGTTISIPSDGVHILYIYADDNAGNSFTYSATYRLDTVLPVISGVTITNNTTGDSNYVKNGDAITITATITDSNQSLLTTSMITADLSAFGGGSVVNPISYDSLTGLATWASLIVSGTGNNDISITVNSLDVAGNPAVSQSITSLADNIAPNIIDNTSPNWFNSTVSVTLTCSDTNGCEEVYYTTDGSDPTLASNTGSTVVFPYDGIFTLKYFSVDNAGNASSILTALNQVMVDQTAPTAIWIDPMAGSARNRIININYTNADNLSGVASSTIFYKLNDGFDNFHFLPTIWDTNPLALGSYTLRIVVTDVAGNSANIDEVIDIIAVISNLKAETIGTDKIIVTWDTNHPTTSKVSWIEGVSNEDNSLVTHHVMVITGLSDSTGYNFESLSRILTGPYSISEERAGARTFSMAGPPPPAAAGPMQAVPVTPIATKPAITERAAKSSIFEVPTAFAAEEESEPTVEGESVIASPIPSFQPAKAASEIPLVNFFSNILNIFQSLLGFLKFW